MGFKVTECVVLKKDLPRRKLRAGDIGTVVEVYEPGGLEVEFVTGSGKTQAVVTLKVADVRTVEPDEILAVRNLKKKTASA